MCMKNKNIEAQSKFPGSYKEKSVIVVKCRIRCSYRYIHNMLYHRAATIACLKAYTA